MVIKLKTSKDIYDKYDEEVKNKYKDTEAYKEYVDKTKDYSKDKWNNVSNEMNSILKEFSIIMKSGNSYDSSSSLELVKKLQEFISINYYNCTNEILFGLGIMYLSDERFRHNIDKNGLGTAEFISNAIKVYCNS